MIRCIIVEDEPSSQEILINYLSDYTKLELVQVCNNAFEAIDALKDESIQLIFLDINLPKLSGLSFLKTLSNPPYIIFTTAYPQYAVDGFEVNAIDFLLKPFPFERFLKAVNKALAVIEGSNKIETPDYILLNADKKIHKVSYADIIFVEAQGDYIKIHTKASHLLVHKTMSDIENQLPANMFIRIHKSFIIAYNSIAYIEGNQVKINNRAIPIGKLYRNDFLNILNKNVK